MLSGALVLLFVCGAVLQLMYENARKKRKKKKKMLTHTTPIMIIKFTAMKGVTFSSLVYVKCSCITMHGATLQGPPLGSKNEH